MNQVFIWNGWKEIDDRYLNAVTFFVDNGFKKIDSYYDV